jgi:2-polyprenyl-3-methyl-5-hydroxy-6-metoxy-1,4-benzoquinol methylase
MQDPAKDLYDRIAERKGESRGSNEYHGGNGRIDRAVDLILNEDFPRSGTLLDIGGATGNLGYSLRNWFDTRVVIDITEECRGPAEAKGNRFYRQNVDGDRNFSNAYDGTVDLICALDFIEHILDPQAFAAGCYRLLKPGGRVLINTPNMQFWRHLSSLVENGVFPHTSGDREVYHGGHVAFFTLDDMHKIFAVFDDHRHHLRGLTPEPSPPIWESLLKSTTNVLLKRQALCYSDLIFSCRKP